MSFSNEQQLLVNLRDGDSGAFSSLYAIYAPRLSVKLVQLLRSEELAEDILQDIFIKIWEVRETIDPDQNFPAFLYKMAANRSKNVFRRNLYDENMRNELGKDLGYDPIENATNESDTKKILDLAMSKLTARQREVYTLHKLEGLSYQEISEKLKISASAINHHIQEATKQLKIALKSYRFDILIVLLPVFLKK